MITSVPNNAVSPNGNTVISIFYFILFVIVVIFTSSLTYFLWYKNKQRAQLEKIAFVDTVTLGDTYNKFLVDAQGILTQCPHKKFHIIKFDIDNFKYINNFYGFEFGDRILRKINESISQQLNAHELIARIYSDHFVILLENAAEGRLNALLSSIENEEITLYFSAGIYSVTDSTESINLMVDKAGTAARSIKGVLNKKFAYYTNKFEQITIHNEQLKRAVKQALKNDEFIPYYQPKVDINSGILVGGEALVRWKTREGKFIFPNEFIPMCEQTGLIVELDMIMYEKVLKFLKSFLEQGLACVPISVNFSRLHLMDSDFLSKIVKKQCEYGVPAHLIEIELTESAIFDNIDTIYAFTRKMHANGFAIAMDDFGSGYSSLNMLKDIPIDVLKIDKGFLSEAADNNRRNIIFSSIADMARKLNIKVVVEGVEHLENVRLMKECGCSIAQGYYFAKPMDEESFRNVFKEGRIC
ncbi:putative bifunctional diguanylate cyclase/phosphodiesterase [Bilophila wadsworthia]|uniref:putative bifunctional diguanylate cyclase/phosphodiesterase n=1 Tax=Bilophila wadsworthia TaxID=35833 RepID=UPI0026DD509D|nr:bifunctional diguanylate cyclase/phosphodiesterase [Bilophila wadsworthia]